MLQGAWPPYTRLLAPDKGPLAYGPLHIKGPLDYGPQYNEIPLEGPPRVGPQQY